MQILSTQYEPLLSPSSMSPRPSTPDDPAALQVLPGSGPGPGRTAADAEHAKLMVGHPPWAGGPVSAPPAADLSGWLAEKWPQQVPAEGPPHDELGHWTEQ